MDNASVCNIIARSAGIMLLKKYGLNFHEGNAHIRCMAHVVNLIVQSLLASLDEAAETQKTTTSLTSTSPSTMIQKMMMRLLKWRTRQMGMKMQMMRMMSLLNFYISILGMRSSKTSLKMSWMRPWTLARSKRYAFMFGIQFAVFTSTTATGDHEEDMFFTSAPKEVQKLCEESLWLESRTSTIKQALGQSHSHPWCSHTLELYSCNDQVGLDASKGDNFVFLMYV